VYARRNIDYLHTVQLTVDGIPFNQLEQKLAPRDDEDLKVTRKVLLNQFGLEIPRKILAEDSRGIARKLAGRVWHDMGVEWSVREGPLKESIQDKACEAGTLMSSLGSQMVEFLSQSANWSGQSWPGFLEGCAAQQLDPSTEVALTQSYQAKDEVSTGGYTNEKFGFQVSM
jgi:hypothetical protein